MFRNTAMATAGTTFEIPKTLGNEIGGMVSLDVV